MPWPAWLAVRSEPPVSPSSSRGWTSGRRRPLWRVSPAGTAGCCRQFQLRKGQGILSLPRLPSGSGSSSGQPGLQFGHRPGEVHGAIRAQRPSGCRPGAGPSFTRLLRAHSPPAGLSRRQRRPCRLRRTCKEASEARMDVLGCGLGAAETGACSATPAGEAARPTQSGSGCQPGFDRGGGLSGDQFGVPGYDSRAEPSCTVGAAALPPSGSVSGKADPGLVTKVNPFYNGIGSLSREIGITGVVWTFWWTLWLSRIASGMWLKCGGASM